MSYRSCQRLPLNRYLSIDYLTKSIPQGQPKLKSLIHQVDVNSHSNDHNHKIRSKIITPNMLNDIFQDEGYETYSQRQVAKSQQFFNNLEVNIDWTLAEFNEIPDVKYEILKTEQASKGLNSNKTFGIKPELLRNLPEILVMGHTNVGKSSLINNLLIPKKSLSKSDQLAYVSAKAGFTKTLNCFRMSNKLRLIDSPGYGRRGIEKQGDMIMNYIERRHRLKKVLLLIDSIEGVRHEDKHILDYLVESGVSFDIVFTKMDEVLKKCFKNNVFGTENYDDKVKSGNQHVLEHYYDLIEDIGDSTTSPRYFFNNAQVNKFINEFQGSKAIRCNILDSCNLL
ncbi:uncharacterized protein KGF55_003269 [Candida pseudojiufengensis]|uniref:uncharacterized protein n=1 Tax=Candida pseudojiufengensis TaxID=497109 RepID=UPI0022252824|nr:uncharacterized protein KGF55_003269 [Candida pseudojiufengensis]KAI5962193.1 hypothetical protein KGF55_003269 [Candida pseudojiufengensis]